MPYNHQSTLPVSKRKLQELEKDVHNAIKNKNIPELKTLVTDHDTKLISSEILADLTKDDRAIPYLKVFLEQPYFIDYKDEYDRNPLSRAIYYNAAAMVDLLIEKCPDLISPADTGNPPLHIAVQQLNVSIVNKLLKAGANPQFERLRDKWTPLKCLQIQKSSDSEQNKIAEEIKKRLNEAIATWNKKTIALSETEATSSDEEAIAPDIIKTYNPDKPGLFKTIFKWFQNSSEKSASPCSTDEPHEKTHLLGGNDPEDYSTSGD